MAVLLLGNLDTEHFAVLGKGVSDFLGIQGSCSFEVDVTVDPVEVAPEDADSDPVVHDDLLVHLVLGPLTLLHRRQSDDPIEPLLDFSGVPLPLGLVYHCRRSPVLTEVLP